MKHTVQALGSAVKSLHRGPTGASSAMILELCHKGETDEAADIAATLTNQGLAKLCASAVVDLIQQGQMDAAAAVAYAHILKGKWDELSKQGNAIIAQHHSDELVQLLAAVTVKAVSQGQTDPVHYIRPLALDLCYEVDCQDEPVVNALAAACVLLTEQGSAGMVAVTGLMALQEGKLQQILELTIRIMERKQAAAVDVSMQLVIQAYSQGLLQLAAGLSYALATSGSLGASTVAAASAGLMDTGHHQEANQLSTLLLDMDLTVLRIITRAMEQQGARWQAAKVSAALIVSGCHSNKVPRLGDLVLDLLHTNEAWLLQLVTDTNVELIDQGHTLEATALTLELLQRGAIKELVIVVTAMVQSGRPEQAAQLSAQVVHDAVQDGLVDRIAQLVVMLAKPNPGLAWLAADTSAAVVDRGWTDELAQLVVEGTKQDSEAMTRVSGQMLARGHSSQAMTLTGTTAMEAAGIAKDWLKEKVSQLTS